MKTGEGFGLALGDVTVSVRVLSNGKLRVLVDDDADTTIAFTTNPLDLNRLADAIHALVTDTKK